MLATDGGYRVVIDLWALNAAPAELTTAESLSADQALACGGALHLAQAPLWGLGRALRTEHPDLPCVLVDLDTAAADDVAGILLAEADVVRLGTLED